MKLLFKFLLFFSIVPIFAQETKSLSSIIEVDSLYREDQFYFGFTYNLLINRPKSISQEKFSSGFTAGFLRDMPLNKNRTIAIASGLGLSYNKYFQNLSVLETDQSYEYSALETISSFSKNKLEQVFVDLPVEFRWRTSTPESHKFWRIYAGFKISYSIYDNYVYVANQVTRKISDNQDLNKLRLGTYLTVGYNTWNFYAYYGITPLFKNSATIYSESIGLNTLNLGLMFYIL